MKLLSLSESTRHRHRPVGLAVLLLALGGSACSDAYDSGPIKACKRLCKKADDCCASPPCAKGLNAMACEAGICRRVGCSGDADCTLSGTSFGTCKQLTINGSKVGLCSAWCSTDKECTAPSRCVAESQGHKICGTPCTKQADCTNAAHQCIKGRYCGPPTQQTTPCTSDADCPGATGHPACDTATGECGCRADPDCGPLQVGGSLYGCV